LSEGCRISCSRSDAAKIVVHEVYEPNTLVDLLDADTLTGKDL
jgi:hypothetical protein